MSIKVERYSEKDSIKWNEFVSKSRNGLFLFDRNFMDYHSDRFNDHSLLLFSEEKLLAIFPANERDSIIYSHQGLTFGGLIMGEFCKTIDVGECLSLIITYYRNLGIKNLIVKPVPSFLHQFSSQEDLYYYHQLGFNLNRRDLSSLLDLSLDHKYSKGRKWIINKARKENVQVLECQDWTTFHEVLSRALSFHNAKPVHSVDELILLHSRFTDKIKLFGAYKDDILIAGALTFSYGKVLHTQYLANSDTGREVGGLDLLLDELIGFTRKSGFHFLSFGISTTEEGKVLNNGLLQQKESYGAKPVVHDWYNLSLI